MPIEQGETRKSDTQRRYIRKRLDSIRSMVSGLLEDCDDDCETLDKNELDAIIDQALTIRDRNISRLEEALAEEENESTTEMGI